MNCCLFLLFLNKLIEEYFFGSFIERDQCFQLLNSMREVERRLFQLHGDDVVLDGDKNLDFGYQNRGTIFNTQKQKPLLPSSKIDSPMAVDLTLDDNSITAARDSYQICSPNESISPTESAVLEQQNSVEEENVEFTPIESSSTISAGSTSAELASTIIAVHATRPIVAELLTSEDNGDGVDLSRIFATSGIALLGERNLDFHASETFKYCWLYAKGYRYNYFT